MMPPSAATATYKWIVLAGEAEAEAKAAAAPPPPHHPQWRHRALRRRRRRRRLDALFERLPSAYEAVVLGCGCGAAPPAFSEGAGPLLLCADLSYEVW